ncbi:hypothetical protein EB118_18235, partial [bacterium]|nr:hypothetical protein [Pseudomonadota bacterium]NDG31999.1 hypothetical protein [bacterium]
GWDGPRVPRSHPDCTGSAVDEGHHAEPGEEVEAGLAEEEGGVEEASRRAAGEGEEEGGQGEELVGLGVGHGLLVPQVGDVCTGSSQPPME